MNSAIRSLAPSVVWNHFVDLNAIPRASKKEERVIQFMVDFGKKLDLETSVDEVGNVIIKKPATQGMEDRKTVVLQSHLDMVHQKNADTDFDFDTQGIAMYIDGDWVKAKGTTLGADNGLGVASIMAVLSSKDIAHPNLEALFTIDEETGMTGAMNLKGGLLKGEILLNLDTEEDDEIGVGCAGGVDITAKGLYTLVETPKNHMAYSISITGLNGGHSGMDIHKGFGNANKLMNRILYFGLQNFDMKISEINGGSLRNAIPRESFSIITIEQELKEQFLTAFHQIVREIQNEFKSLEKELSITLKEVALPKSIMDKTAQKKLLLAIYGALNGVYRMSPDIESLVETSNNIARVVVNKGTISIGCLTRSSSETNKWDLANSLKSTFELAGFSVEYSGNYPGWLPNMNADILKVMKQTYIKLFDSQPHVAACHAGLECGILGQNYPDMDMISFGPNIRGAHSPDEKAQISSMQKFWKFFLEILKHTP